jgi:hypothetical protein
MRFGLHTPPIVRTIRNSNSICVRKATLLLALMLDLRI